MPQLDQVTFFSQFFWLCFFFFGFYFVICKHFLPKMGRILKFRKKKMNLSGEGAQSMQQENEKVRASCKAVVENGLNVCNNLLFSHFQRIESWLHGVITNTNKKQLEKTNALYVEWVGDNSIRQQLALQTAAFLPSPGIYAFILAEKCKAGLFLAAGISQRESAAGAQEKINWSSRSDSLDQPFGEKIKRELLKKGMVRGNRERSDVGGK